MAFKKYKMVIIIGIVLIVVALVALLLFQTQKEYASHLEFLEEIKQISV